MSIESNLNVREQQFLPIYSLITATRARMGNGKEPRGVGPYGRMKCPTWWENKGFMVAEDNRRFKIS